MVSARQVTRFWCAQSKALNAEGSSAWSSGGQMFVMHPAFSDLGMSSQGLFLFFNLLHTDEQ